MSTLTVIGSPSASELLRALQATQAELADANALAAAGEDARKAMALLRGLVDLAKETAGDADPDPYWQMAELILNSTAAAETTPATTSGSAR
jgi:hypothetical protein